MNCLDAGPAGDPPHTASRAPLGKDSGGQSLDFAHVCPDMVQPRCFMLLRPVNHRIPSQTVPCLPSKIQITQSSPRLLPALHPHTPRPPWTPLTSFQCCNEGPVPLASKPLVMPPPSPTPPSSFRLEFGCCSPQEFSLCFPRPLTGPTAPCAGSNSAFIPLCWISPIASPHGSLKVAIASDHAPPRAEITSDHAPSRAEIVSHHSPSRAEIASDHAPPGAEIVSDHAS